MATFGKLVAATGLLEGVASLIATRAAIAETKADVFIHATLPHFDKGTWTVTSLPPEVSEAWENVASAWYLRLEIAKASPENNDQAKYSDFLMAQAEVIVARISERGWTVDMSGERLESIKAGSTYTIRRIR